MIRIVILIIGAAVVGLDQLLKAFVSQQISFGESITIMPGVLSLTKVHNSGAAWSSFQGKMWFFYLITIIAVAIVLPLIIRDFKRKANLVYFSGLVLILAGTIGNFIDRFLNSYVVDMFQLDFVNFPIFNIADFALTIGVILLFIFVLFLDKDSEKEPK